jgi:hypothetical protein
MDNIFRRDGHKAARGVVAVVGLICLALSVGLPRRSAAEPVVREQRSIVVNDIKQTWRLVWDGTPGTVCSPDEVYMAVTCPCAGWAYAEFGKLSLFRSRAEHEIERMDLAPLFGKFDYPGAEVEGVAYLQRWPRKPDDLDREDRGDGNLVAEIKTRAAPAIIKFADYNRDGAATEFLIQVGTLPCGKLQFAAVGVTARNPHLHALTSVARPATPLLMPLDAWRALQRGAGPTIVHTWDCGDHGSDMRRELVVSAQGGAIKVRERAFSCPIDGASEQLIEANDR